MKFKEKNGNYYVFDGGYDDKEFVLHKVNGEFIFLGGVAVSKELYVRTINGASAPLSTIQIALNLMQILIEDKLI